MAGYNDQQSRKLKIVHVSALLEADRLVVCNVMLYDRVFNFSDFSSDDDVPNIRYLKAYVDANLGTGTAANVLATSIPLPTKTASDLIQDGFEWFVILPGTLPAMPTITVYVSRAGDNSDMEALPVKYRPATNRLYGFDDPATSPNQKIYISYIGTTAGSTGGATTTGGTITTLTIKNQTTGGYIDATLTGSGPDEGWNFADSAATAGTDYLTIINTTTGLSVKATIIGSGQNIGWNYE